MSRPAPSWDTRSRVRPGQAWLVTIGLLSLAPALIATALRVFPPTDDFPALVAAFIPYGLVFWLPSLLLLGSAAVRARRDTTAARVALLLLAGVCLVGGSATVAWEAPDFVPDRRPVTTETLTVASLNVEHGGADPSATADQVSGVDIASFVEATPNWVNALPLSFREEFPYAVGAPLQYDAGSVIFSRYPITSSEALPTSSFQQWSATVQTPQLGALRVVAVHPCNPFCGPGLWTTEHTELRAWLARQDDTPTVVLGDFNAVDDHGPMRQLFADGWRSSADLVGAGYVRTFPANGRVPPLLAIDHVLVDDRLTATAFETFDVPTTDHLGVRAVIAGTTGTSPPG